MEKHSKIAPPMGSQTIQTLQNIKTTLDALSATACKAQMGQIMDTYTNFNGEIIEVECIEWLEDGRYYDDETEEELPCSRYCVGVDENGEGISVWLNDDMQEVDA